MLALIIEDNHMLAENMIEYLESHAIECDYASNGCQGLALALENTYSAIILDIMLPGNDGISICQSLRQLGSNTPILMLTARDTLEDKLQGFNAGADDYLVKPFDLAELVARIKVLFKRTQDTRQLLYFADLKMDIACRHVSRSGQTIKLNRVSWQLLEALLRASPNVITRQEIEQIIWPEALPDSDALKSHIYQLRKVIDKPFASSLIKTVRGVGLVLNNPYHET